MNDVRKEGVTRLIKAWAKLMKMELPKDFKVETCKIVTPDDLSRFDEVVATIQVITDLMGQLVSETQEDKIKFVRVFFEKYFPSPELLEILDEYLKRVGIDLSKTKEESGEDTEDSFEEISPKRRKK